MPTPHVPAPGSVQAQELGCECPVEANHHGMVPPVSKNHQWWVLDDCPLHGSWLATQRQEPADGS